MILETALICLTMTIYHEARSEPVMGRHAVAQVVMNRAGRDPKNVCKVIAAPKQFSWTNKSFGMAKLKEGKLILTKKGMPTDKFALDAARKIAIVTLNGRMSDFTHGANHYHATYVAPGWKDRMEKVALFGHHLFYRYNA